MTFQLTPRDKKLLYFLAVVLLVAGLGYFCIVPALERGLALEEQRLMTEQELAMKRQQQKSIPLREEQRSALMDELAAARAHLFAPIKSADADKLITGLLASHGFTPRDLTIAMNQREPLSPYPFSVEALARAAGGGEGNAAKAAIRGGAYQYISIIDISGVARGSQGDWLRFLDTLHKDYPAIRLESFAVRTVTERQGELSEEYTELSFRLTIACYNGLEGAA